VKKASKKLPGCLGCSWNGHIKVEPEDCEDPDLLIIAEAPGEEDKNTGRPFMGDTGIIIRSLLKKHGLRAVLFNSVQCHSTEKPNSKVLKACREEYVIPILSQPEYVGLPILALGEYAGKTLLGGTKKPRNGSVYRLHEHDIYFTHHPVDYLSKGKNKKTLSHIETMMKSSVSSVFPKYEQRDSLNIKDIMNSPILSIDIETTSKDYPWVGGGEILLTGLYDGRHTYTTMDVTQLKFLEEYEGTLVGHNYLYDIVYCLYYGLDLTKCKYYDTKIGIKFSNSPCDDTSLKYSAKRLYNAPGYEAEISTYLLEHDGSLKGIDYEILKKYNEYDVVYTYNLCRDLKITQPVPFNLNMDYLHYIAKMIQNGMYIDKELVEKLSNEYKVKIDSVLSTIEKDTHIGFNPGSWQQVKTLFKSRYMISLPDTKEETLDEYTAQYPIAKHIVDYKGLVHFRGTFCEGYLKWVDKDSLLHSKFSVAGAITNRMTSSSPNLQNDDPRIRCSFKSRYPGGRLLYSDLSALEYREIAHMSQDKILLELFNAGKDIHIAAYSAIFGVDEDKVTKEQRFIGKTCNYSAVYGQGAASFFKKFGVEDYSIYERSKNRYPRVNILRDQVLLKLRKTNSIMSIFGTVWVFDRVTRDVEREAFNYTVQSPGHDILEIYLMEVFDAIKAAGLHKVLLVNEKHDSFIFDCPPESVDEAYQICKEIGSDINPIIERYFGVKMSVPFFADVQIVENIGEV